MFNSNRIILMMKKLLVIIVLNLFWFGQVTADEIILRCKVNEVTTQYPMNERFTLEINLDEKKLYIQDELHKLKIIGDRVIVSEKRYGSSIKLDRYDGYFEFIYEDTPTTKIDGYCKKFDKLF
jgi:hypothetical protein